MFLLLIASAYFLSHYSFEKTAQAVFQPPTWINTDFHIHTGAVKTSASILAEMKNLNINVGHALIWGLYQAYDGGNFLGQNNDPVSEPNNILRWDVEISLLPGHYNGHMVMLNIADPNAISANTVGYPGKDYLFPNLNYVQSTGGIVGYDHASAWIIGDFGKPIKGTIRPYELALDIALGKVDFLGTQDVSSPQFYWLWYQMLNAGFHIAPVSGSDSPNHSPLGSVTTMVALDADIPFTFQNHIEAVRQGKTVVRRTTAVPDYLDIRVNNTGLGANVNVPAGTTTVTAEIDARSATNTTMDVIVNGNVFQSINITNTQTTYTVTIPITKSSWIAVRTPDAHTAATFILVDGKAIRNDPVSALKWRDYLEQYYSWGTTETREDGQKIFGTSASIIRTKVDEAKAIWATIAQDGSTGNFQFSPATYSISESAGTATVTVNRVNGSAGTISVGYGDWYGTSIPPTRGVDYQAVQGVLTFPNGVTSQTISIPILEDTIKESNEFFQIWLFNPSSGSSITGTNPALVTIVDNDTSGSAPGNFQFSPATYSISESAGTATVTVNRVNGSAGTISVGYGDWYGTSIPPTRGVDYQAVQGVLTFPNGVTSQTISIPILEDTIKESNEFFQIWLFNPSSGSSITGTNPALVTILDND